LGEKETAAALLDELLLRSAKGEKGVNLYVAHVYRALGDISSATTWLGKARKTNDIDLIWFNVDPLLEPLRSVSKTPDFEGAERFIQEKLRNELPSKLYYHNTEHIDDVLQSALVIAAHEQLTEEEIKLLRIAALFHDSGMTISHKQHEEKGCELARQILPSYGFRDDQLDIISGMIMATKIPQSPKTQLERILCDADLDYLGRDDFYTIGEKLHEELRDSGTIETVREWNLIQKTFLENHRYHTEYSRKHREAMKQQHLQEIAAKLRKP
jgi:predicted metal-dependent HD superfamily phosphohydrolase